jgi:hypothetical protein
MVLIVLILVLPKFPPSAIEGPSDGLALDGRLGRVRNGSDFVPEVREDVVDRVA